MILRQDIRRSLFALLRFLEAAITYFSFFFFFFYFPLLNQFPSRSPAVQKLTTWITGRDISKVTSSLATMRREAMSLATEALITTSGPVESYKRVIETYIIDRERERERERHRERELTTTANRKGQRPREIMRERGEREERRREARRTKMINK